MTELAAKGATEASIWRSLRIPRNQWRERKKTDDALQGALDEGRAMDLHVCLHALRAAAIDAKGALKKHEKALTALLAYLKLSHGLRDHGAQPSPAETGVRVTINLPGPMRPEDYSRNLIDVTPKEPTDG